MLTRFNSSFSNLRKVQSRIYRNCKRNAKRYLSTTLICKNKHKGCSKSCKQQPVIQSRRDKEALAEVQDTITLGVIRNKKLINPYR